MSSAQLFVLATFGLLAGAAVGSFMCVVIDRMPYRLDEPNEWGDEYDTRPWREIVAGNSACADCGAQIGWARKVPVASWVLLRGKCGDCGGRIPGFHPLVELAVPLFWLAIWVVPGITWRTLPLVLMVPACVAVAVIDIRTYIVPTRLVWPSFGLVVLASALAVAIDRQPTWLLGAIVGVAVFAGPLALIWWFMPSGMGFGDVRLAVLLGWVMGFVSYEDRWTTSLFVTVLAIVLSACLGIVGGIGGLMTQGRKAKVPFGPSLFLGAFVISVFAEEILQGFEMI